MSDSSSNNANPQQVVQPAVQNPPPAPRFVKLRVALGMLPEPSGKPPYIWVERWNARIIGIMVAVGVPLLAFIGLSTQTRLWIALAWAMIWSPFFFYFEGRELIGQMMGRGAIKQEQLSEQQDTAQDPFYGVIAAFVIWLVVWAVHVSLQAWPNETTWQFVSGLVKAMYHSLWTTPVPFGAIEWIILVQAWMVTRYVNYIMYNTGNTFSKAAPMGERTERRG